MDNKQRFNRERYVECWSFWQGNKMHNDWAIRTYWTMWWHHFQGLIQEKSRWKTNWILASIDRF